MLIIFVYAKLIPNKYLCISDSITTDLLLRQSLMPIGVGILYGLGLGFIVKYVPERTDVSIIKYIVKNTSNNCFSNLLGF